MTGTLLVFGHGYTATALSRRLVPLGWRVVGTVRNPDRMRQLTEIGVEARLWPGDDLGDIPEQASHILMSIAPDAGGDPVLNGLGGRMARAGQRAWIGYLSTTGVYGDRGGGWVDEGSALAPVTRRGAWRVNAEAAWHERIERTHIFRLAGIYGPGRGPFEKVRAGTARRIIRPGQVFSRIHVDDLVSVLIASMQRPDPGTIYNVCDDLAAPPEDVIEYAARLLGMDVPVAVPFASAEMSPMARSFYSESKRVRNDRIKAELSVALQYPTYRQGLRAIVDREIAGP